MDERTEAARRRQQQTEARDHLRRLGVEIDAGDHRDPVEIVSALAAIGIKRTALESDTATGQRPSLTERRSVSPYLAF